jgi:hypothetical protein
MLNHKRLFFRRFAASSLSICDPRLAPWAAFLRRFATEEGAKEVQKRASGAALDQGVELSASLKQWPDTNLVLSLQAARHSAGVSISRPKCSCAPLGLSHFPLATHGLRRGLHSHAASRLNRVLKKSEGGTSPASYVPTKIFLRPAGAFSRSVATPRLAPWAVFFRRFAAFLFSLLPTAYAVG